MKESPLMIKSKSFALDVIMVCKELRNAKCESALINFCVQAQALVRIFEKHSTLMARQISYLNKLLLFITITLNPAIF